MKLTPDFRKGIVTLTLAVVLAGACHAATVAPANFATSDQILSVVAAARVPVRSAEVEFLVPIVLNDPHTQLRLVHIERSEDDSAMARLACVNSGACLPFYVVLHWNDPQERMAVLGPPRPKVVPVNANPAVAKPMLVRAGRQATLLMQNGKMRIATPIICLQNGAMGEQIRVSSLDHKRVVVAEVIDSGVLKGSL